MTPRTRGAITAFAVTSVLLAGCSTATGPVEGDEIRIAFFNPIAANAATAANQAGVQAAADELDATVTVFDAGFDQAAQISQIDDAIAAGIYDAFVIMPVNGAALVGATEDAIAAGIKVVADWNNIGADISSIEPQVAGLSSVVAQSMQTQGELLGEETVKACEGIDPCVVIYMPGSFSQGSEQLRLDAALSITGAHSNIEVNTSADGQYSAGPAEAAANDVLLAIDNISVFVSPGDQMTVGIIQAIEDAGKMGQIKVVSAGATKEGIQLVRDGKIFSNIVLLPWTEGYYSAKHAILAARGESVPASLDSTTLSPFGPVANLETLNSPEGKDFVGEYSG